MTKSLIAVLLVTSFLSLGCAVTPHAHAKIAIDSSSKLLEVWPQDMYFTKREMSDLDVPDRSLIIKFDRIIQIKGDDTFSVWKNQIDNLK